MDTNQGSDQTSPVHHAGFRDMGEKLYNDLGLLLQREVALVRAEFKEKVTDLRKGTIAMGIGMSLIFLSIFALMATIIMVLGMIVPWWSAALAVTILFALVGFALYKGGKGKIDMDELRPRHSLEALNEMKKIVKENYYEFKSGPKQ